MLATKKKTIDGTEYTCTTMPATKALDIMRRLIAVVGEGVFAWASGAHDDDADTMSLAGKVLISRLGETDVAALAKDMLSSVSVGSEDLSRTFDLHFAGRIGHLMRVLLFVLECNYRDFFDALPWTGAGQADGQPPA